jgi:hypothetical protein
MPKTMVSKLPLVPISCGSSTCSLSSTSLHHGRAEEGAPDMAHAAQHGHEQVFDALVDAEGRGADAALEVREQPARHGRQDGREDEDATSL